MHPRDMSTRIVTPADECARHLALGVLQSVIHDDQWRLFGFRGTPRRGRVWDRFINQDRLAFETFLRQEFVVVALAAVCRSIRRGLARQWAAPVLGRVLSVVIARDIRDALHLTTAQAALDFLEGGVQPYSAAREDRWNIIFHGRSPAFHDKRHSARLFVGSALIMLPSRSIFPHVASASANVCADFAYATRPIYVEANAAVVEEVATRMLQAERSPEVG